MKATLISVGTEILMGQTMNTNVMFLSQELNKIGVDVMYHHTVGDNPKRLRELMDLAYKDCDVVITTGGLGPTQDDLTKEIVTEALGDHLVMNEDILQQLEEYFVGKGRPFTENNRKQCMLPSQGEVFQNHKGTAPGFALEMDGKIAICIPGPPWEMEYMYNENVKRFLESKSHQVLRFRDIRCYGIGESQLETELLELINGQTNPTLATYAKENECFLRIAAKADREEEAMAMIDEYLPRVRQLVGSYIYDENGTELKKVVANMLIENDITISCAESLTGGMFASTLVDNAGISKVFDRGLVTYTDRAKIQELDVEPDVLAIHGAVSAETAMEMADGVRRMSGSKMNVSCTGVAGPDGGTEEDPAGTAYIGVSFNGRTTAYRIQTRNLSREANRNATVMAMLNIVYRRLQQYLEEQAAKKAEEN